VATTDGAVAEQIERLALHGLSVGAWQRFSDAGFRHYEVVQPGHKFNLTDIGAALGIHQLPRLDAWISARAERWQRYDELLADLPLELPSPPQEGTLHARHLYQVLAAPDERLTRDELLDSLTAQRIGAGVHYRGVHLHPYYRDRYGLDPEEFPVATDISERTLSLPLGPTLSERDQEDVALALRNAFTGSPRRPAPRTRGAVS
jgi:dTDP-4-amino-4,6-dideoxygalactose transaminase